ncbi:MAG: DUF4337 domain-containing protein [Candidatus Eremiobacteraeota bacterium]|nr:DUF4337 domain-containing protein [Candidatus Eremiobacteraeota bacterium]
MADFSAKKALDEAAERHHHSTTRDHRLIAILGAILAVLAALATLFAHQRSTLAIVAKNEAVLAQAKASDQYNFYETTKIKYELNQSLLNSKLITDKAAQTRLEASSAREAKAVGSISQQAHEYENESAAQQLSSERALRSFETLEIAVTLFEVAIVLVSISALTTNRALISLSLAAGAVGLGYFVVGILQHSS